MSPENRAYIKHMRDTRKELDLLAKSMDCNDYHQERRKYTYECASMFIDTLIDQCKLAFYEPRS